MNKLDKDYQDLLRDILENGTKKQDRTGTGTLSVFGRQLRHDFRDGFPLLTTKRMAFKQIVTELIWFLRGDTSIKFLVDNDCHIWDGDAYKNYLSKIQTYTDSLSVPDDISEFQGVMDSLSKQIKSDVLTQEEFINKIKTDDEFAKKWGDLGPVYGRMWRAFDEDADGGIDQITNLINDLKTNPDSRRLLVTAWNPTYLPHQVLPPCHYGFQVYTRELSYEERCDIFKPNTKNFRTETNSVIKDLNIKIMNDTETPTRAISLMWSQRSVDTGLGLSFNIASYSLLLMMIAKQVNMVPDEVIGNLGDVHLYLNHIEPIKEQLTREPYPLPSVKLSDKVVNDLSEYTYQDIILENYQSHPKIYFPLSN